MTSHRHCSGVGPSKLTALEVRVSRTLAADGSEVTHGSVPCPTRGFLAQSECSRCDDLAATIETEGVVTVMCRHRGRELPLLPPARPAGVRSSADATPVAEITKSVVCIERNVTVAQAAALLLELEVSGLPVVDDRNRLAGVISKTDLVRHSWEPGRHSRDGTVPVATIMTTDPVSIVATTSVADACKLMVDESVHRLPVVSESGEVLGIVTPLDVLEWLAG